MELVLIFVLLSVAFIATWKHCWRICNRYQQVDWGSPLVNFLDGLIRFYCHRFHRLKPSYIQLPETGSAIIVSNHISGLDPFLIIAASKRPVRFLMAREYYDIYGLNYAFRAAGCIPVDRDKHSATAMREAIIALEAGDVIAIFPQGEIVWPPSPASGLKGGAVRLAQKTNTFLFPVYISGLRFKGHVVRCFLFRANAHLDMFGAHNCVSTRPQECLDQLACILNNSRHLPI